MTSTSMELDANGLAAALAWVDESDFAGFDADIDSSLSPPSPPQSELSSIDQETDHATSSKRSGDTEASTLTTGTRKRRYNAKEELQYLRGAVKQLEGRLAILQDGSAPTESTRQRRESTTPPVTALDNMWARIADRQFKKLESSERENARLRGLVEDQLRLIRGLERMLMKKRTKVMSWYAGGGPRSVAGEFVDPMEDPELEKAMERGVEDMLGDVDRIFADPRYTTDWEEPLHLAAFTANENDMPIVETLDARLFPFPYKAAADTLWAIWTNTNKPTLHNFHRLDVEATDVRVRRVIEGEFNFKGRLVPFRAKLIARRLVQADRIVIPAMLLIDPMHMNGEKHSGVFLRERAWNVFHAAPKDENIPSDIPVACRKSYSLTTPKLFDCDDNHTVGRLTNSLICTTSMRLSMNNEAMEDRLVASFEKLGLSG